MATLEERLEALERAREEHSGDLRRLDEQIRELRQQIAEQQKRERGLVPLINQRFDAVNQRFDTLEKTLTYQSDKFLGVEKKNTFFFFRSRWLLSK